MVVIPLRLNAALCPCVPTAGDLAEVTLHLKMD